MEIERIAVANAQQTTLFNIADVNRENIDNSKLFIICKNGQLDFINNLVENDRITKTKNAILKYNLSLPSTTNFCVQLSLHDFWDEKGILTFGKTQHHNSVCFPDLYQLENYDGKIDYVKAQNLPFQSKKSKVVFAGVSTGSMEIENNDRVNMCIWSIKDSWAMHNTYFKITKIVQMEHEYFNNYLSKLHLKTKNVCSDFYDIPSQLNYKYIMSIDGNGYAWDRPVWVMASKSLLFKHNRDVNHLGWYYELLKPDLHFVEVNKNNIENKFNFYQNNPNIAEEMIKNANNFVDTYCNKSAVTKYLQHFFTSLSDRY